MRDSIPESQLAPTVRMRAIPAQPLSRVAHAARKVPEITIYFWIVKLLTTAMGESTSDYLVYHLPNPYIAVILGFVGFVVAMALQLIVRRYIAGVYWLAVVMVAIFGTMGADVVNIVILVHFPLRVRYEISSAFFAVSLAVIFALWYLTEKTLSIHSIYTLRRELFYWATIVATFALGTAVGDMTAVTLNLGYLLSGVLFIALFLLPAIGYRFLRLNAIFAFWFAYVMTRPLGASFADWIGKPQYLTGLGYGTGPLSLVLGVIIVAFVAYLSITRIDVQRDGRATPKTQRRM